MGEENFQIIGADGAALFPVSRLASLPDRGRFCGNAIAAPHRGPRAI